MRIGRYIAGPITACGHQSLILPDPFTLTRIKLRLCLKLKKVSAKEMRSSLQIDPNQQEIDEFCYSLKMNSGALQTGKQPLILVGTDGSDTADRAIDCAAKLGKGLGGRLMIVTVAGNLDAEETKQFARAEGRLGDVIEAMSSEILIRARERARKASMSDIEVHTCWGDVADSIIALAARENADMIVLGRRGRGRLAGLLLGSVSQKVVTLAPCVVAVVP
jgi:nucleotide-binding universal stress UspA family protein